MDDSTLVGTIKKILEDKMAASAMDINVESKNGNIHLSGMVDTLGEKVVASKIVEHIKGVESIENNITIATDGYIPDSDIEAYVQHRFNNTKDLSNVSPIVEGGALTLVGHVETFGDEKKAIELAEQTMGVKSVASNIKIDTKGKYDDTQITSRVTQLLASNRIDTKDVDPVVRHNTVTLQGFVENRYEVELAQELVGNIEGVAKVKNYLRTRD